MLSNEVSVFLENELMIWNITNLKHPRTCGYIYTKSVPWFWHGWELLCQGANALFAALRSKFGMAWPGWPAFSLNCAFKCIWYLSRFFALLEKWFTNLHLDSSLDQFSTKKAIILFTLWACMQQVVFSLTITAFPEYSHMLLSGYNNIRKVLI